jgi:alanine dehydrogenase
MIIGVVKEIKDKENRVALTPTGAAMLAQQGHTVRVESGAGEGAGFSDDDYKSAGAMLTNTTDAWDADLALKVKEPQAIEYQYLRQNILFTYLHLAGVSIELTRALLKAKTTAIAYETVEDQERRFPLLAPMSAIAGNMAAIVGSYYLAKTNGGKGVQLGRILGTRHGKVMVLGDGVVGQHSALTADALGANVYLFGKSRKKYETLTRVQPHGITFVESNEENIRQHLRDTDLLIGAVLIAGARAPRLVTEEMVRSMQPGSVLVDVSIDQGGCIETSHPTTHSNPKYVKHGVIHYCVSNMPGAYPRTATQALTHATLPYAMKLAQLGLKAVQADPSFGRGVNTYNGFITRKEVADALSLQAQYKEFSVQQFLSC